MAIRHNRKPVHARAVESREPEIAGVDPEDVAPDIRAVKQREADAVEMSEAVHGSARRIPPQKRVRALLEVVSREDLTLYLYEPTELRALFSEQVTLWEDETSFVSDLGEKLGHAAYLRIIGMGRQVIPLILERMHTKPEHWFIALKAIAGESPVPRGSDFDTATRLWLDWGVAKGYLH